MKLQRKILINFILISFLINFLFLLNFIHTKKNSEMNRLDSKIARNCELLNQVNSGPLYDYDLEKIKVNILSFLKDPDIVSITLTENNNNIHIHYEDPDFNTKFTIEKNVDITFDNEKIGELKILFSTFELNKRMNHTTRDLFLSFLFITIIMSLFLYFFIRRIIKPVTDLTDIASEIAEGNLEKTIQISTNDEIGILARNFESMQNSIKQKISFLKIENEKREHTLFRSRKQQAAILKIADTDNLNISWYEEMKLITEVAANAMGIDRASIWKIDGEKNQLACENLFLNNEKSHEIIESLDLRQVPDYFKSIFNNAFVATVDAKNDIRTKELYNYLESNGIQSVLDVPIKIHTKLFGIIKFEKINEKHLWTPDECVFAERVGDQLANYLIEQEKKHLLKALKESEERFQLLTQNLKSVIIYQLTLDKDWNRNFTYVSPNIWEIDGVSQQDVLRDPNVLYSQIFPEFLNSLQEAENLAMTNFSTFEFEMKVNIPGKINQWRQLIATPRKLDNGLVIWDGVQIDITDRKRVDEYRKNINDINEIILQSESVSQLEDNILTAVFNMFKCDRCWFVDGFDPTKNYYTISNIMTTENYMVKAGTKIKREMSADNSTIALIMKNEPLAFYTSQEPRVPEYLQQKFDVKSMLIGVIRPQIGKNLMLGIHQCSNERIWTNEEKLLMKEIINKLTISINTLLYSIELKKTQKYISNIIDSMPSILVGVDKYGQITRWNREAEKNLKLSFSEVKGKHVFDIIYFYEEEKQKILENMESKEKLIFAKRSRRTQGKMVYENITLFPLIANGIEGAVIRIDDITDRVNLEEMMIQSEKMMSIGGLAAGMAHEINNPLAGIIQNAQVLQNRMTRDNPANLKFCDKNSISFESIKTYFQDRKIDHLISNILNSGNRAGEIVKNMLTFARLDIESKISTNIPNIIDKTIELVSSDYDLKKKYDFRRIEIIKKYSKNIPEVLCSPTKIQQVLLNIFKNGAEAMAEKDYEGGHPTFIIKNYIKDDWSIIEIGDNGPGINKEIQKRIFEPFYTTKDPGIGTGLGLSISYFIITENHKGDMWVESYPSEGTKFYIRLPLE